MLKSLIFTVILGAAVVADKMTTKPDCIRRHEWALKTNSPLIPKCYSNGAFKPLQCYKDSQFCSCWSKLGRPITNPSTKLKYCDCPIMQNEAIKKYVTGGYIPRCDPNGLFSKRQCRGSSSYCWCVDRVRGVQLGDAAVGVKCD